MFGMLNTDLVSHCTSAHMQSSSTYYARYLLYLYTIKTLDFSKQIRILYYFFYYTVWNDDPPDCLFLSLIVT